MNKERRQYTDDEKRAALALADKIGLVRAAEQLGMPKTSLSNWRHPRNGRAETPPPAAPPPPAAAPPPPPAAAPRVEVANPAAPPAAGPPAPSRPASSVEHRYTPSEIARALERLAAVGLRPAAAELGISRNALRDWKRKAERAARGEGPAPTSGPDPADVEADRDAKIVAEWNKQRGLGPSQIRNQLRRGGFRVSVQTVRRVMEDNGYLPPKVERRDHTGRYEAVRPNQLWHLDFLHRHIHKQPVFLFAMIDDFSRFVPGWAIDDAERADCVISAFEQAVERYGKPEAIMHDGGSAFWAWKGASRFTRILEEYGVDQYKVDIPQTNGKIEVFNGNIQKELFDRVTFSDVGDLRRRLGPHFHWYNHHRTHHALGGILVPGDRFYGRADEVMARIEAGGSAGDALDVATRPLELFRVVSQNGKPEVWLMGQKIFAAT